MREIEGQVDEFIEGLFSGDIIHIPYGSSTREAIKQTMTKANFEKLKTAIRSLRMDLIPAYRKAEGKSKKELAEKIFDMIIMLRLNDYILNNPDSSKELAYWKNRCLTLELEVTKKDQVIESLAGDIQKLRVGSGAIR